MNRWRKSRRTASCPVCWLLLTFFFITIRGSAATGAGQGTWWKGNLHTHSLWSDGDFYASSGVRLKEVRRGSDRYEIEIDPEAGVTYTTEFIGTRKGFDRSSKPALDEKGELMPVTRQYSKDIGQVLAEVTGPSATYPLKGDEIYVRARIISSKLKANPYVKGEFERAWTQPLIPNR